MTKEIMYSTTNNVVTNVPAVCAHHRLNKFGMQKYNILYNNALKIRSPPGKNVNITIH